MVYGKLWMVHADKIKWPLKFAWHIDCWVKQGLIALEKNPYVPAGNRGRKSLVMEAGDKTNAIVVILCFIPD